MTATIIWFDEARCRDRALVGGKGAGLAEMSQAGLRVPPGFVVTTAAFRAALGPDLRRDIDEQLARFDPDQPTSELERFAAELRGRVVEATAGHRTRDAIDEAYEQLRRTVGTDLPVAVRSSSAAEDSADKSFAGEHDTYLWVDGAEALQDCVRSCWASLFTARTLSYRLRIGSAALDDAMAVVVQRMVPATAAGVFMTLNPSNGDPSKVVIESVWGLGEPLVSGQVTPDRFVVDKVSGEILRRDVAVKKSAAVRDPHAAHGVVAAAVPQGRREQPSLTDAEIGELVRLARLVEQRSGCPQDGEFALDEGAAPDNVFLLQTRPETVWSRRARSGVAGGRTALQSVLATLTAGAGVPGAAGGHPG
ncbi:PEP/pyruvate-binding domain-containing protein [Pseudonocardia asaccharolytica]|uniref:Phosphoenolpyruvate synthase n=1 Tax=Pseudonocardia asaccharolytica DSM 44247 = NBRC 16224 TaxID=1123024 RepID=A0A511CXD2_9PSEU|nr:PEP/pyruvate-binding domain-containing protein [Pseudonocardia asaccharolytica]GEL17211.1 phosphoenolpyruvate synthase [Pseudonocardia asaccharolytica DSM 44247 = NBRC 16224]